MYSSAFYRIICKNMYINIYTIYNNNFYIFLIICKYLYMIYFKYFFENLLIFGIFYIFYKEK